MNTNTNSYPAKIKVAKQELKIGTWNVHMVRGTGKLEFLHKEIQAYNCNILGLAETLWTGKGDINGGKVIWSGKLTECRWGVDFLLSKRARSVLLGYNSVSPRLIYTSFRGIPLNFSFIQVYMPTANSSEEEIKAIYSLLEVTMLQIPKKKT